MAPLKLLCLHAKANTAESFEKRTAFLSTELGLQCSYPQASHEFEDGTFVWWKTAPGVRSFNATDFEGCDQSLTELEKYWRKEGPFEGVVGFSQGAMLTAIILAKSMADPQYPIRPRFAILMGAAMPRAYESVMNEAKAVSHTAIPTLHVLGQADDINPMSEGLLVKECFGSNAEEYVHSGAHIIPSDEISIQRYREFLEKLQ